MPSISERAQNMTTEPKPYVPFTAQQGFETYEIPTLDEHVTPHLARPLWKWCEQQLRRDYDEIGRMGLRMRLVLSENPMQDLLSMVNKSNDVLLNIVHWIVSESRLWTYDPRGLNGILTNGGSAWIADYDAKVLRRRLSRDEEESLRYSLAPGDATATHLREAWTAAWRREDPSAVEAYDRAVKSLESILAPIVIPNHPTPTLGKVIKALRDKPEKWDTRFRGSPTVEALAAMLDEVWKTQVRHGKSEYLDNTLEEAQDAVTIAVAVVGLCRRGFLERLNEYTPEEEAEDLAIADAALERYQSANMKTVPYEEVIADWAAEESSS